jgi:hypothetical protein
MLYKHGFSVKGKEYETVIESNEAEVAKYAPKIYFNFKRDTVVFGGRDTAEPGANNVSHW